VIERIITIGFLTILVCSTLALGTVEAWSVALLELATIALMMLWAIKAVRDRTLQVRFPSIAWPIAALLVLGLLQSISIASGDGRLSISRDVEATRAAVTVTFFLFVLLLVAANFFTSAEQMRNLTAFFAVWGLALAVFALIQHFTWDGKLFWFRPVKSASGYGGPFVNRNHFAGYMEMLAPISLAMALSRGVRAELRALYGFAAVMMGISIAASLSRGGMVSLGASLVFMAIASAWMIRQDGRRKSRLLLLGHSALLIGLIAACIIIGIVWVGADFGIAERLVSENVSVATSRHNIWRDSLRLFAANPIAGIGLGAFETAFPMYSQADGSQVIEFAHNDYLQVLTDAGIIGGGLALWFLFAVARCVKQAALSREPRLRAIALGASAGIFALLVHSIFDFNLQIPSNALLFLFLCSMVWQIAVISRVQQPASVEKRSVHQPREVVHAAFS